MGDKRKVKVEKKRHVITYAELWYTCLNLLKRGQENEEGSYYMFMGSVVFAAFSLEAYLNHLGPKVFRCWGPLDRLGPKEKLDVIAEKIDLPIDYGKRPWGIVKELVGFRNSIAHGRSDMLAVTNPVSISEYTNYMRELMETNWEKLCTRRHAERAHKDVEAIVKALHAKAGIKDEYPFAGGWQDAMATLMENP
jgi:hypothetical protein